MTQIFISYSRSDEVFARQLATALSNLSADIWIDIEDIPAGMKWSSAIQQGLDSADALIVIISPEAMASRNVEDEWQYFLDHGKPVIPVFLRPSKIHFQLNRIQWVDFKDQPFDIALVDLHGELKRNGIAIDKPPQPTTQLPPQSHGHAAPPAPKTNELEPAQKRLVPAVIGLGVMAVVIIAVIFALSVGNNNTLQDDDLTATAQETRIAELEAATITFAAAIEEQTQVAQTAQAQLQANQTETAQADNLTQTAQAIPTEVEIFTGPVTNNDWEPIERDFNGVTMVLVPSGRLTMGVTQAQYNANLAICREKFDGETCSGLLDDEFNGEEMIIRNPYWIDKYEVSQRQYGSTSNEEPQVNISSQDALSYCESRGGRLPSESQWEYAAKGPEGWRYPWGNTWDLNNVRANICDANCSNNWREANYDDSYAQDAPVTAIHGSESWVGAFNMVGNVWEWTSDAYTNGATNTLRGGAWTWIQAESTTTSRADGIAPVTDFYGFRCVRPFSEGDLNS